jgi:hypothetical protein
MAVYYGKIADIMTGDMYGLTPSYPPLCFSREGEGGMSTWISKI